MNPQALVFEVNDSSYDKYVLLNSHKVPVVMTFIAAWSEHCYAQDVQFTRLAGEFPEQFIFAKLDIEENEEAKSRYKISNVPTTIVFRDGEEVRREQGVLDEADARALLKDFGVYRESDEMRMQARSLHIERQTAQAITLLASAMKKDPSNVRVAMDMVQIFIDLDKLDEAEGLLGRLPETALETSTGQALKAQLNTRRLAAKTDGVDTLMQRVTQDGNDYDARFDLALCLLANNDYSAAMEQLFFLLENKADYHQGAPREMIISVIESLTEASPELAQAYRRQLANLLSE